MADNTKRITDVDYLESLKSNDSFFVNQNNAIKQISKSDIVFDIINGGTGANNASDARTNLEVYSTVEVEEKIEEEFNARIILSNIDDKVDGVSELQKGTLYLVYEEEEEE